MSDDKQAGHIHIITTILALIGIAVLFSVLHRSSSTEGEHQQYRLLEERVASLEDKVRALEAEEENSVIRSTGVPSARQPN